ncbi:MAG: serine hydrolase domain-containing protein [Verrucomicrobiales bacterium]
MTETLLNRKNGKKFMQRLSKFVICMLLGNGPTWAAPVELRETLEGAQRQWGVPSVAAVAFSSEKMLGQGVVGQRKTGAGTPVTLDDKYHVGSITKSMTATLAAIGVESGRLRWDTTLGEALDDLRMHAEVRSVTLGQLLRHRSGLERDIPDDLFNQLRLGRERPTRQREKLARELLKRPPKSAPEAAYEYSNAGYTFAGLMIERRIGQPWEKLMMEKIFNPLGMKSAGFGAPAKDPRKIDQPWGHDSSGQPVAPGPLADNVSAIGPAGTVHMSLPDLARYGQWHLRERGPLKPPLLRPETVQLLHGAGQRDGYHFGWERHSREWAGGQALYHNGSNTMFYAVIWLAPNRDFGLAVATNMGGPKAEQACDDVAGKLVMTFCPARRLQ